MRDECLSEQRATEIRNAVKGTYRLVSKQPSGVLPYPVGRDSALGLGYERGWLEAISADVVERFVGVGNPIGIRRPNDGERVLDAGCGCGFDSFVASLLVGARGRVVGVDLTPEMLEVARRASAAWPLRNIQFMEGSVENLPFEDGSFDLVISNGVLNLVPDKDAAFRQLSRILVPGGSFVAADILVDEAIPEEVLADKDAWSH
jgi:arsenite methyltransferase